MKSMIINQICHIIITHVAHLSLYLLIWLNIYMPALGNYGGTDYVHTLVWLLSNLLSLPSVLSSHLYCGPLLHQNYLKKKKLEYSCCTLWCQCLLYSKLNQPYIHIYPPFLDFLPIKVTTEHWAELPQLYSRFSLVIYFIHSSVDICQYQSPNSPHPPAFSPLVIIRFFSTAVFLFLLCK